MRKFWVYVGFLMLGFIPTAHGADENILLFMNTVKNEHIEQIDLTKLTMAAFEGLHKMDPKVRVANDKSRFTFYYDAKVYKNFNKPESDDTTDWAELIDRVFKAAVQISPKISLKDYEAPDAMMSKMVESLDKDSKLYTAIEMADKSKLRRKVNFSSRKIGDILYVRIGSFGVNTYLQIKKLLQSEQNIQALILDLRGNSGGQLASASKVAGMFLEGGIVFMTKGISEATNRVYQATAKDEFDEKPVVVLVDSKTASAAEIVAGSLQEQSRAIIMGTETFGKGTTQHLVEFPNGSILAITNAKIYLPSGKAFINNGVMPDFCLSVPHDEINSFIASKPQGERKCEHQEREGNEEDVKMAVELLKTRI